MFPDRAYSMENIGSQPISSWIILCGQQTFSNNDNLIYMFEQNLPIIAFIKGRIFNVDFFLYDLIFNQKIVTPFDKQVFGNLLIDDQPPHIWNNIC